MDVPTAIGAVLEYLFTHKNNVEFSHIFNDLSHGYERQMGLMRKPNLAMGDSLAAGFGAIPVTQGYAYLLYKGGTFDSLTNTIFADAAAPGATSAHVLAFQVPQAVNIFQPHVVTISVGGNDPGWHRPGNRTDGLPGEPC